MNQSDDAPHKYDDKRMTYKCLLSHDLTAKREISNKD